jgi:hypothetical protein
MYLFGEICLTGGWSLTSQDLVYKFLGSFECIALGERIRYKPTASYDENHRMIKQKSADGIVAKRLP